MELPSAETVITPEQKAKNTGMMVGKAIAEFAQNTGKLELLETWPQFAEEFLTYLANPSGDLNQSQMVAGFLLTAKAVFAEQNNPSSQLSGNTNDAGSMAKYTKELITNIVVPKPDGMQVRIKTSDKQAGNVVHVANTPATPVIPTP